MTLVSDLFNLQKMDITEETEYLPIIVFVGDKGSFKCKLLQSLGGLTCESSQLASDQKMLIRYQKVKSKNPIISIDNRSTSSPVKDETDLARLIEEKKKPDEMLTIVVKNENVPDLLIMDLPEINTENEEKVKDMLRKNAGGDDSIIVCVMSQTPSNSRAVEFSKLVDNDGKRTIYVIEKKPDTEQSTQEMLPNSSLGVFTGERPEVFQDQLADRLVQHQYLLIANYLPKLYKKTKDRLKEEFRNTYENHADAAKVMDLIAKSMVMTGIEFIDGFIDRDVASLLENLKEGMMSAVRLHGKFLQHELDYVQNLFEKQELVKRKLGPAYTFLEKFVNEACAKLESNLAMMVSVDIESCNLSRCLERMREVVRLTVESLKNKLQTQIHDMFDAEQKTCFTCEGTPSEVPESLDWFHDALERKEAKCDVPNLGITEIDHLREVSWTELKAAFDAWRPLDLYLQNVVRRLVENVVLFLRFLIATGICMEQLGDFLISDLLLQKETLEKWYGGGSGILELLHSKEKMEEILASLPVAYQIDPHYEIFSMFS